MHSILEGVVKNFFKFWFSAEYRASESFSLRKFMIQIDQKLVIIKPPSFVPNAPRSIETWKQWRAHEYLPFLLYYAIPVFNNIMPDKMLKSIVKLVIYIEILLSKEINTNHLNSAQNLIVEFIDELSSLYPDCIFLSGVHELLHFVDCTLDFGPLNLTNLFTYEELNRVIVRSIKGKDLIGEEFIKLYSTVQLLSKIEPSSQELKDFLQEHSIFKTSNRKNQAKIGKEINFLSQKLISNIDYLNIYNALTNKNLVQIDSLNRLQYKGHIYTASSENTKFCDSCFMNSDVAFGLIKTFLYDKLNVYVLAKKMSVVFNFNSENHSVKSNLFMCHVTDDFILAKIEDIKKCALIFISDTECYLSKFPISHLFT